MKKFLLPFLFALFCVTIWGCETEQLPDDTFDSTASYTKVWESEGSYFAYSFRLDWENYYVEPLLEGAEFDTAEDHYISYQDKKYYRAFGRGGIFQHTIKNYEHTFKNDDGKLTVVANEDGSVTVTKVSGEIMSEIFQVGDILLKNIIFYPDSNQNGAVVVD